MGYNNHISGKKELCFEIDESVDGEIKFGNNIILLVFGREKIPISLKNGSTNFISDVFYVHELHHNLLSMDQLSKKKNMIFALGMVITPFLIKKILK